MRGRRRLRPKIRRPSIPRYSENVPTGQSQEQKAFFSKRLISRNAEKEKHGRGMDWRVCGRCAKGI